MFFQRLYDEQLAQASYLIGCSATGESLVVDPARDVEPYLAAAAGEGLRITHVTETHIHADFVSGARELAHRAGARLYLSDEGGPEWRYAYAASAGAEMLHEGSDFRVGNVGVRVLHTPGHTPEHLSFLITDGAAATSPMGALTGDFVFVGDVGRPDLLERAAGMEGTMEAGARQLFRSLQRFRDFPDYLQIWPGHGAGSACGKSLGAVPQTTLGYEKRYNWAFGIGDEEEFVRAVLEGQPDPPRYFAKMKRINRDGPRVRGENPYPQPVSAEALARALAGGGVVVDTRPAQAYLSGAIPGTINVPLNRSFTTWAGWLLPYDRDFHLIVDGQAGVPELAARDLAAIGLDRFAGYAGTEVVDRWRAPLQRIPSLNLGEAQSEVRAGGSAVLDVRGEGEWAAGHLPGSINIPVGHLEERLSEVPRDRPILVHCQTGARAAIAASLLRAHGFERVALFPGGFAEWQAATGPVERSPA